MNRHTFAPVPKGSPEGRSGLGRAALGLRGPDGAGLASKELGRALQGLTGLGWVELGVVL